MGAWWTHSKYWFWAAVAVGLAVLVLVLRGIFQKKGKTGDSGFGGLPPAPEVIQRIADTAYENSVTVKANTRAETAAQKEVLVIISKIEDGKARRKALADFVNKS